MARAFTIASSSTLLAGSAPVTAAPLTLACWFKADDITNTHTLFGLFKAGGAAGSGAEAFYLSATGASAGDFVSAVAATDPNIYGVANSSLAYSSGVWQHACGVFSSATSRTAYLDGTNSGSDTTSVTPSGIDRTNVGFFTYSEGNLFSDCSVAEAAIWAGVLNADEVAALARGFSPLMIRPGNLLYYSPLIGRYSPEIELMEGNNGTVSNAAQADHPRVIYPSPPIFIPSAGEIAAFENPRMRPLFMSSD